jgi:hypothetical protein
VWRQQVSSYSRLPRTESARCRNLEDDGPTENLKSDVNLYLLKVRFLFITIFEALSVLLEI